jgi:hypothetical protein
MDEIVTNVRRVSDLMSEISTAAQQQSDDIQQMNHAVDLIDQGTQQNAALVEEASAAARSMEEQSAQLLQTVASFRVQGGAGHRHGGGAARGLGAATGLFFRFRCRRVRSCGRHAWPGTGPGRRVRPGRADRRLRRVPARPRRC